MHLQNDIPGVEITSGSLGNGLGIAAGMALAAQRDRKNYMVFVLLGDAECYEGSVWEAAMFASHNRLNNLVAIIDRNRMGVTNWTENMLEFEPFSEKWRSFGWHPIVMPGHSLENLMQLEILRNRGVPRPVVVIAETTKGQGVSFMQNELGWHGIAPKNIEAKKAAKELG